MAMAIAIRTTDFPEGTGEVLYKRIVAEVNLATDPPQGMIFHWAEDLDGKFTVTGIWDTREANQRFLEQRLFPAIRKLSGREPRAGDQPVVSEHRVSNYLPRLANDRELPPSESPSRSRIIDEDDSPR